MFSIFFKLGWFIKKHWIKYIVAITFLNVASFISVIPPKILELGIDEIINKTITRDSLLRLILIMLLITIIGYFVSFLWTYLLYGTGNKLEYTIRKNYFEHLLKMDNKFYERNVVGDLMARATSDLGQVAQTAGYGILALTDATVYLVFILFMMMYTISFKLTIVSLIPLPFIVIGVKILGDRIHKSYTESQNAFSAMNNKVLESVSGVRVVRAYVQEEDDIKRLEGSAMNAVNKNINLIKVDALFDPLFKIVFTIAYAIAFSYGIFLVFNQELTPGQLVSFSVYLGMLGWPMFALGDAVNVMQRGNASYDRIQNIMSQKPEVEEPAIPEYVGEDLNELTFEHVTFSYPNGGFNAIDEISFKLNKGKTLGIVGKTGSGKTTILRQILKQYKLLHGAIRINEIDIKDIDTKNVRKFFGYVPQEHILFTGTVYKNIAFGKKGATEEEINKAIDMAAFRKDIAFLDNGLDTIVGEQGVTLSGGQKQRLSIARAFVTNPEVLILDDSLSAVDGTTERMILKNLKISRKDKTTIIVAHRLSAVEHSDEIIVLDDGKIIERGNHEQLMKLNGWYAKQYIHQQMIYKKSGDM
ncbi:MAG: transporter ATP-binding protein/permease [Haloplasmataceae bacterium]|jgi:ABC-type multidrug transport system fused ATPase/permease subunit|nr:transporter ATP-binding protein/permease [Haloplasmataceae bacterium]